MAPLSALIALVFAACPLAREIPDNLQDFYDDVRDRDSCGKKLATGFWSSDEDDSSFLTNTIEFYARSC